MLLGSPCRPLGCSLTLLALSLKQANGSTGQRSTGQRATGQRNNNDDDRRSGSKQIFLPVHLLLLTHGAEHASLLVHQRGAPRSPASLGLSSVPERVRAKRLQKFVLVSRDAECCYRCSRKQDPVTEPCEVEDRVVVVSEAEMATVAGSSF